jgi:hypothetical protein
LSDVQSNQMSNIQLLNQEVPDFLQNAGVSELTKSLVGRPRNKRLVPKNGIWTKMVGGEAMGKLKGDIDVVIVNAAPHVGRIFYATAWNPDAEPTAPDCFSNDGRVPDAKSVNVQGDRCDDCPQNIKGSGQGQSKACRYNRFIAVLLKDDFGTALEGEVYQIKLASKSLFGDNDANAYTFENYTKYLGNNGKSVDHVVTRILFNENNDNQSVMFAPVGYINRQQYDVAQKVASLPTTKALVTMTPSQADGVTKLPPPMPKAPPAAKVVEDVEDVEDEPPSKRPSKKTADTETPVPKSKKVLADVVSAWSKED